MKIANIVYNSDLVNHIERSYINYIRGNVEYESIGNTLPTLYVGWKFLKESNPNNNTIQNANILNKTIINNNLFWEYSFDENKPIHVNGVEMFVINAQYYYFNDKYEYINLDPVFFKIENVKDLIKNIPERLNKVYNYKNEMLYLLQNKLIIGINLLMFDYFQININDTINMVKQHTENFVDDINGEIYQKYYKIFPNYSRLKRYLVTILE